MVLGAYVRLGIRGFRIQERLRAFWALGEGEGFGGFGGSRGFRGFRV